MGAERIGHGIQSINDPQVLSLLISHGTMLEVCPSSNVLCNGVPNMKSHPVRKLFDLGVKVCVNTDDPGVFHGVTMPSEMQNLALYHQFSLQELRLINRQALQASFISEDKKLALMKKFAF